LALALASKRTGLGLEENWPWPQRLLALALASKRELALTLASNTTGLGLKHAVLEPIPARSYQNLKGLINVPVLTTNFR